MREQEKTKGTKTQNLILNGNHLQPTRRIVNQSLKREFMEPHSLHVAKLAGKFNVGYIYKPLVKKRLHARVG